MLAVALLASGAAAGAGNVSWKGKSFPLDRLPADMPEASKSAIARWAPWCEEHRYRLDLDLTGRALLISPAGNASVSRQMSLIAEVVGLTDERLPAPPRGAAAAHAEPVDSGGESIPEDPEAPSAPARPSFDEQLKPVTTAWGAGANQLDHDTVVLFVVHDEEQYASLLDALSAIAPYLAPWASSAKKLQGFALEEPLAGAFLLNASGQEEWDPENELVHRAAELLLLRRFGRQPYWLLQGWAWHVEMTLCKDVYCFPYRAEFVWASEHTGWDKALRDHLEALKEPALAISDIAALRRGGWQDRGAKFAWGTALFLDRHRAPALAQILEDLRLAWDAGSRRELGNGQWERVADFEVAPADQSAILVRRAGEAFWPELTRFFRAGSPPPTARPPSKQAQRRGH